MPDTEGGNYLFRLRGLTDSPIFRLFCCFVISNEIPALPLGPAGEQSLFKCAGFDVRHSPW